MLLKYNWYKKLNNEKKKQSYGICEMCGKKYLKLQNKQRFCGSKGFKIGCSYKNYLLVSKKNSTEYRKNFPEKVKECNKNWVNKNPEKVKQIQRNWCSNNIERKRELVRISYHKNKTVKKEYLKKQKSSLV